MNEEDVVSLLSLTLKSVSVCLTLCLDIDMEQTIAMVIANQTQCHSREQCDLSVTHTHFLPCYPVVDSAYSRSSNTLLIH